MVEIDCLSGSIDSGFVQPERTPEQIIEVVGRIFLVLLHESTIRNGSNYRYLLIDYEYHVIACG